jgi:hypothetical protein
MLTYDIDILQIIPVLLLIENIAISIEDVINSPVRTGLIQSQTRLVIKIT